MEGMYFQDLKLSGVDLSFSTHSMLKARRAVLFPSRIRYNVGCMEIGGRTDCKRELLHLEFVEIGYAGFFYGIGGVITPQSVAV